MSREPPEVYEDPSKAVRPAAVQQRHLDAAQMLQNGTGTLAHMDKLAARQRIAQALADAEEQTGDVKRVLTRLVGWLTECANGTAKAKDEALQKQDYSGMLRTSARHAALTQTIEFISDLTKESSHV